MQDYTILEYAITSLIVFNTLWITFYTFNPYFVQVISECDLYPRPGANPDPIKCYIYAFLLTVLILFSVHVIKYIKNNIN